MTKTEIAERIVMETLLSREDLVTTVNEFMESLKSAMINGENVYLRGFGTFHLQKRTEKTGRNILAKLQLFSQNTLYHLLNLLLSLKKKSEIQRSNISYTSGVAIVY